MVSNVAGSVTSNSAYLWVSAAPLNNVAPTITTQPVDQAVAAGNSATFSVSASGTPAPTYQWQRNGSDIAGATGASYTLGSTTTADSNSTFRVVVSNIAGVATSSSALLTVTSGNNNVAPTIITEPASQGVTAGGSAIFSVVATGTPAPTYQWRWNGSPISGATSSSFIVNPALVGYSNSVLSVVVSNAAGSVTSNGAALWVSP